MVLLDFGWLPIYPLRLAILHSTRFVQQSLKWKNKFGMIPISCLLHNQKQRQSQHIYQTLRHSQYRNRLPFKCPLRVAKPPLLLLHHYLQQAFLRLYVLRHSQAVELMSIYRTIQRRLLSLPSSEHNSRLTPIVLVENGHTSTIQADGNGTPDNQGRNRIVSLPDGTIITFPPLLSPDPSQGVLNRYHLTVPDGQRLECGSSVTYEGHFVSLSKDASLISLDGGTVTDFYILREALAPRAQTEETLGWAVRLPSGKFMLLLQDNSEESHSFQLLNGATEVAVDNIYVVRLDQLHQVSILKDKSTIVIDNTYTITLGSQLTATVEAPAPVLVSAHVTESATAPEDVAIRSSDGRIITVTNGKETNTAAFSTQLANSSGYRNFSIEALLAFCIVLGRTVLLWVD